MSCGRGFAAIVMLAVSLVGVSAQEVSSQASPPAPPRVVVGEEGIALESGNGNYRLQIGLLLHADGRFALADESEQYVDNFVVRRFRPYLRGRLGRHFEFFVNPDFAGGTLTVQDAYVDTIFAPAFRIRAGKGKTPFGFERLHPAANMLFMERAFPTALAPNRDIGVQVLGDLSGGVVSYLAGVMNGVADGASADVETNDGKDLSGRLVLRPFNRAKSGSRRSRARFRHRGFARRRSRHSRAARAAHADAAAALLFVCHRRYALVGCRRRSDPLLAEHLVFPQSLRRVGRIRAHADTGPPWRHARRDRP